MSQSEEGGKFVATTLQAHKRSRAESESQKAALSGDFLIVRDQNDRRNGRGWKKA